MNSWELMITIFHTIWKSILKRNIQGYLGAHPVSQLNNMWALRALSLSWDGATEKATLFGQCHQKSPIFLLKIFKISQLPLFLSAEWSECLHIEELHQLKVFVDFTCWMYIQTVPVKGKQLKRSHYSIKMAFFFVENKFNWISIHKFTRKNNFWFILIYHWSKWLRN